MEELYKILAINPGSTSTKIAIFQNEKKVFSQNVSHDAEELKMFEDIPDQLPYRRDFILEAVEEAGYSIEDMDAFVGRGGALESCTSGTYLVEGILLEHASTCHAAHHPSALGAVLAHEFAKKKNKPAFIVNPPDVDEFEMVAHVTGIAGVIRQSRFHVLNQKEVAMRVAKQIGKTYDTSNLVVAHLGGGISITAHKYGRAVDTNDIINGDGPMAPTRCGQVDVASIIEMCFSGRYSKKQMEAYTSKNGGIVNHLGISDIREVIKMIEKGDEYAKLIYDAMIYQIGKAIGSYASVLCGEVDAIILTGGIAHDKYVVDELTRMNAYIAPIITVPGEFEMEALASGAYRVLSGMEPVKHYTGEPIFKGLELIKAGK